MTADYLECLQAAERRPASTTFPQATEHIADIIEIIAGLIDKGYAYAAGGDVYFDVAKDADYGKLCNRDPEQLEAGARDRGRATRSATPATSPCGRRPSRASRRGTARGARAGPGWHIECSAMSMKLLGETLDIHGGGLDLQFPAPRERTGPVASRSRGKPFARVLDAQRPAARWAAARWPGSVGNVAQRGRRC